MSRCKWNTNICYDTSFRFGSGERSRIEEIGAKCSSGEFTSIVDVRGEGRWKIGCERGLYGSVAVHCSFRERRRENPRMEAEGGSITYQDKRIELKKEGELVSKKLYSILVGLQTGRIEDKKGWIMEIC